MFDLINNRLCDHKIFDEKLTLQGASPNYFAILKYQSNNDPTKFDIREFAETDGITGYSYTINGFTNWALSPDGRQINFNSLGLGGGGTGVASFADGATLIIPSKVYVSTYYTLDTICPLHDLPGPQSSPIQKDININESGQLTTVTGKDKVRQAVMKALLTAVGSNKFNSTYGSWLSNVIGQKFDMYAQFTIQQSIQDAVDFLIQQQQQATTFIPQDERIFKVSSVNVSTSDTSPVTIRVSVNILTGSYENVEVSLGVTI